MKKYYWKSSNREVKLGETVSLTIPCDTKFGKGETSVRVVITEDNIAQFIKENLIRTDYIIEDSDIQPLRPYLQKIAKEEGVSEICIWYLVRFLDNQSPVAGLTFLMNCLSRKFNASKTKESIVYYLDPLTSYKVAVVTPNIKGMIVFYSKEDAEKAYSILKPYIERVLYAGK